MTATARRMLTMAAGAVVIAGAWAAHGRATGVPQSFTYLQGGFTQQLIGRTTDLLSGDIDDDGVPDGILGGVAFAGNGDPMVAECEFEGTRIHRFDLDGAPETINDTDFAPEAIIDSQGGCGLVNHPNGNMYVAMNDMIAGVAVIDRDTAAGTGFLGLPANSLGIAVDPQTSYLVYAAADCRFTGTCTFRWVNPDNGDSGVFAEVDGAELEFVDGMYFDPSGEYLFMAQRSPNFALTIVNRDGDVVQHVMMDSEPDGVAFHAETPKFVVTNNTDGTMTRFDFPDDDYSQPPVDIPFASGGFRGDLTQVGPDGCIYLTQKGTRYNDGTETEWDSPENSLVRICSDTMTGGTDGGFVPPPGVTPEEEETLPGSISGMAFHDLDRDGFKDPGEPGIGSVAMTLGPSSEIATTSPAPAGAYGFVDLLEGSYSVTAPAAADGKAISTPPAILVELAEGEDRADVDFGYVDGGISGYAYVDANHNGTFESGEAVLPGVAITLAGGPTVNTNPDGSYSFGSLDAATYSVNAAAIGAGHNLATVSPLPVVLAPGELRTNVNFGYLNGSISGFAYHDANGNGSKDPGESGLANVTISIESPIGSMLTNADGSYAFTGLLAGSFSVSAPGAAGTYSLTTPSPLAPSVAVGQQVVDVNFGYQPPATQIPSEFCSKASVKSVLDPVTGRYPNNQGLDHFVHTVQGQSIQAAIDTAEDRNGDGYIIVGVSAKAVIGELGGNVTENLAINRVFPKPFALFACSVTVHDPVPGDALPTGRITSAASVAVDPAQLGIYVMDVHANGSAVAGWKVEGNKRYLRNVETRANGIGVWFVGNNNTMHNGVAEANTGAGLYIQGNANVVTETDVMANGGHGVQGVGDGNQILKADVGEAGVGNHLDGINVSGASTVLSENDVFGSWGTGIRVTGNGSQLLKNKVGEKNKGNGGDGIRLSGAGSLLAENLVYANTGDGIEVSGGSAGSPNVLRLNKSGDKTKGNGGSGLLVAGAGNGTANPVEIDENTVKSNGLIGVQVTGSGHQLKKNTSGGSASGETNVGCEFMAATGNFNATGNKANGTTVAGSNNSPFPTSCVGS